MFGKKVFMSLTLAGVLTLGSIGALCSRAAERIDTSKSVTIVAQVDNNDNSIFATEYTGKLDISLYKLAAYDETGEATLRDEYKDKGIDLSVLSDSPTVAKVEKKIVNPALTAIENKDADATIELDRENATSARVPLEGGAGIYLYVPEATTDDRYSYTFTPYVISAPGSEYLATGSGSDTWQYTVSFNIKSAAEDRTGNLVIEKKLDEYNTSLGKASFVYKVKAILDNETVLDNVYTIDFDSAGTKSRTISGIPATATVTVEEVYTGAGYDVVGADNISVTIVADDTVTASFTNKSNGKLIYSGIAAENNFVDEDGTIYWIDSEGNKIQQTSGGQ